MSYVVLGFFTIMLANTCTKAAFNINKFKLDFELLLSFF
jgi:hypothetical protein